MPSPKSPLSHFQVLAPELVFQICSYLDKEDLPNLLPTCRYLHNAVSGYLRDEANRTTVNTLSEAVSRDNLLGIEFTRKAKSGKDVDTRIGLGVLIEALETLIKHKTKVVTIAMKANAYSISSDGHRDLLLTLKAFSYTRPASEFAINSITAELPPDEIAKVFDVRKLTRLNLSFHVKPWSQIPKYDSGVLNIEGAEYRNATIEERQILRANAYKQYEEPSPEIIADIASLNKLLVRAQSLEYLQLTPIMYHYKKFRPLETLPSELEELKETFIKLKRLRSFELDGFLFHISFFPPIPENVERLSLKNIQYYSKAWWMEFAKHKFTNLKELQLDYDPVFRQYSMYESDTSLLHRDGTLKTPDEVENGFKLGNVEVQGLERFIHERTHNPLFNKHFCFPADLVSCIVRRNGGLGQKTKQSLANRHAEETIERCRERLEKVMESCRDAVKGELVSEFLEGNLQEDDLEKCLSFYVRYVLGKPRPKY
ncbi:hypothetical protein TWF281_010197 [Arthrobotrys megalospora]